MHFRRATVTILVMMRMGTPPDISTVIDLEAEAVGTNQGDIKTKASNELDL